MNLLAKVPNRILHYFHFLYYFECPRWKFSGIQVGIHGFTLWSHQDFKIITSLFYFYKCKVFLNTTGSTQLLLIFVV